MEVNVDFIYCFEKLVIKQNSAVTSVATDFEIRKTFADTDAKQVKGLVDARCEKS